MISQLGASARNRPKSGKRPRIKPADREVVAGFLVLLSRAKTLEAEARRARAMVPA